MTGNILRDQSFAKENHSGSLSSLANPDKVMTDLHREAFVVDDHVHVMTRELLMETDIG